jgi:uncharacterized membrane protein
MLDKLKAFLQSIISGVLPDVLGKGPGFVAFGLVQAGLIAYLLAHGVEGSGIGMAFTPLNLGLFGAGAWKAASDNRVAANGAAHGAGAAK